jgi:hypothetical protein
VVEALGELGWLLWGLMHGAAWASFECGPAQPFEISGCSGHAPRITGTCFLPLLYMAGGGVTCVLPLTVVLAFSVLSLSHAHQSCV